MVTRRNYLKFTTSIIVGGMVLSRSSLAENRSGHSKAISKPGMRLHVELPHEKTDKAILILPTINGLDPAIKQYAKELARQGMAAIIWDQYQGVDVYQLEGAGPLLKARELKDDDMIRNMKVAIDYIETELNITKIGTLGWCLGGRYGFLLAARDKRVKAFASYYPTIYPKMPTKINSRKVLPSSSSEWPEELIIKRSDNPGQTIDEFVEVKKIDCPVKIVRPGHDLMQEAEYEKLFKLLKARDALTILEYYPKASHGFFERQDFIDNKNAHDISWSQTHAFFKSILV